MKLDGQVAVVTGGNGAMGPSIVKALAERGATPVVWDVYLGDAGPGAVACDVGDAAAVESAMDRTVAEWGLPTVIVAAAAVSGGVSPRAVDASGADWSRVLTAPEVWTRVLNTNVVGTANCLRAFARRLAEHGRPGAAIAVSSIGAGPVAEPGLTAYAASKAAVNQLVRVAAAEFGPLGIRVNVVGAGVMADRMLGPDRTGRDGAGADARPTGFVADVRRFVPIEQRHGRGEDVADAVCAVLQLDWVTGQVVYADGGITLRSPVTT
jgi:NAD(P)-dependent dehydrogenase (short-subunit alcohol dehydrogenase family)